MLNLGFRFRLIDPRIAREPGTGLPGAIRRRASTALRERLLPLPARGARAFGHGIARPLRTHTLRAQARGARQGGLWIHAGMPALVGPLYPFFKRWIPEALFYLVPALMWLVLSIRYRSVTLPSAANPKMEAGGLWGESKSRDMRLFGLEARRWTAPFVVVPGCGSAARIPAAIAVARDAMDRAGLAYPLIAKPDRGYQGWGVKQVADDCELAAYLADVGEDTEVILQQFVHFGGEAGIFYVREPGSARGRIVSMALTYAPHVVGDGRASLAELVQADRVLRKSGGIFRARHAGQWDRVLARGEVVVLSNGRSARVGAVYRDARGLVTPALSRRIDAIARDIDAFHFGRFDIRFDSVEQLQRGEGLVILELNGAGGEMLHLWDGRTRLRDAYRALWGQYCMLFAVGAQNARRGHRPTGLMGMIRLQRQQELLRKAYPPSN